MKKIRICKLWWNVPQKRDNQELSSSVMILADAHYVRVLMKWILCFRECYMNHKCLFMHIP